MSWFFDNPWFAWQSAYHWIAQAFIVIFIALLADYFQRRILGRVQRQLTEKTRTLWDEALVAALRSPLSLLIWITGIGFAAEIAGKGTQVSLFEMVLPLRALGVIAAFTWFLISLVRNGEQAILQGNGRAEMALDPVAVQAVARLLRVSIFITAALVAVQTLGFSISGVLAFGGIGGVMVGFASKDMLANLFGSLMISLDRPFAVGEWIRSPDKEIEGTVEHIGWRLTRIRTFDMRPLYVPNAVFTSISVENPSRMTNRRLYETIGIRYEDGAKMAPICRDVLSMLREHKEIDPGRILMVNFNAFAPSSLDFFIYAFTRTTEWARFHQIKQDILLRIIAIVGQHGAEVAFPTSTIHLANPPDPREKPAEQPEPENIV